MGPATLLKTIVVGDGSVGKTSLMSRFINNTFDEQSFHTIGVEFLNKEVMVRDNKITMQIWDTAGQERFKSLRTPFYRGADCCLIVYAVNNRESFNSLVTWHEEFLKYADIEEDTGFPFAIVGNKADLNTWEVSKEEAESFCAQRGFPPPFFTSAKESTNVDEAFVTTASQARLRDAAANNNDVDLRVTLDCKRKGCC